MRSEASFALPTRAGAVFLGALLIVVTLFATATSAQAKTNTAPLGAPVDVSGTLEDGGTFAGQIKHGKITVENGEAFLSGVLVGTANLADGTTQQIRQPFSDIPVDVSNTSGVCDILFLDVGPIFLDLLGLQVDLSEIVLDVNAVSGPGNLLGNLLCGLVGILD